MKNVVIVLILAGGVLGGAVALMPRLGSEFLPALNEGALYVTFSLPGNISLSDGRALTPEAGGHPAPHAGGGVRAVAARPPRRRHRHQAAEQPGVVRQAQADGRVAPRQAHDERSDRGDELRPAADPGHRLQLLAADPRQRGGERLRPKGPGRAQDLRRRSGQADHRRRKGARRDRQDPRRGRRRHHQIGQHAADRRAPRSPSAGALRSRSGRRAGLHRDRDGRAHRQRVLGRREALRRHRALTHRDARGHRRHSQDHVAAEGRHAAPAVGDRRGVDGHRARRHHPRKRPALHRRAHERARPRSRLVRGRSAAEGQRPKSRSRRATRSPGAASSKTSSAPWRACGS